MVRRYRFSALVVAGALLASPAFAADYPEMRSSFPLDWVKDSPADPVGFEAGLRYWYSLGGRNYEVSGNKESAKDTSHILEGYLRIDDYSTNTFLRGNVGYSIAISNDYSGDWGSGTSSNGAVGYANADLGQYWFGDAQNGVGVGGFLGYQLMYDNPDMGRANYTTATSADDITWSTSSTYWTAPGASEANDLYINALRLGVTAKAKLGDFGDLTVDVAGIPYANLTGTMGAFGVGQSGSNPTYIQSSPTEVNGWGYGATADIMLGFHPIENMNIRIGGRAEYLQGQYDANYSVAAITDQTDSNSDGTYDTAPVYSNQSYISTDNPFSMWRYGAMMELTYAF